MATGREIPYQCQNKGELLWGIDGVATEGQPLHLSTPSAAQGQLLCILAGCCKDKCTKHCQVIKATEMDPLQLGQMDERGKKQWVIRRSEGSASQLPSQDSAHCCPVLLRLLTADGDCQTPHLPDN